MNKSGFIIVDLGPHQVGLQDAQGKGIVPCCYDKILDYDDDGYIRLLKGGIYATIDLHGKLCIPHDKGLTHLGVFHNGTARACKGGKWGLVTPEGEEISPFTYLYLSSYRYKTKDYLAIRKDKVKGMLSTQGLFTPFHPHNVQPQPEPQPAPQPQPKPKPKPVIKTVQIFDAEAFVNHLRYWMEGLVHDIQYYYLDTDAPVDIKKIYKRGTFLRAGRYIDTTDHLLRPVTHVRFLIASPLLPTRQDVLDYSRQVSSCPPFRGSIIYPEATFYVRDVYRYAGTTQIFLLHIPTAAAVLVQKYKVSLAKIPFKNSKDTLLQKAARTDLRLKSGDIVHGISLSPYWQQQMYQPIGLDADFKLISETFPPSDHPSNDASDYAGIIRRLAKDEADEWNEAHFMKDKTVTEAEQAPDK